jgi:hypothetical protein
MRWSRKTIGLVALAVAAFGLRAAVVAALRPDDPAPQTYEHGRIAENLLAGRGFTIELLGVEGPTSQQAPFYPLLTAAAYWCFGVGSPAAILAIQLLQCLAGTALVLAVAWLGWSLLPDRPIAGWLAAFGAAVYPTHLYMVTHLQVAPWAALILTVLLAVCVSPRWQATRGGALLAGCLAGALLLVEPILAVAIPICAAAFWMGEGDGSWRGRFAWRPIGRVALMAAVAAVLIAPWIARNWAVHGRPVFIKSTFGYAFWQGNNPASWGTDKIPKPSAETLRRDHDGTLAGMDRAMWEARHETLYIDDVLLKPRGYREFQGLSEPDRCDLLGRRAWEFVRENPGRYARLCVNRLRYFLLFDETNPKAANRVYRLATVAWLVLAVIGLAVSRPWWRRLWPTYAIFAAVTFFHTLVIVSARFRIPVEPISFVWASLTIAPILDRWLPQGIRVYRPGEGARDALDERAILPGPHFDVAARRRVG